MSIGVVGHCQAASLAKVMGAITRRDDFDHIHMGGLRSESRDNIAETLTKHDSLIVLSNFLAEIKTYLSDKLGKIEIIVAPTIYFTGYHPDFVHATGGVRSPLGNPQSAIGLYGLLNRLTIEETAKLYCDYAYESLGYYNHWKSSIEMLRAESNISGIDLVSMLPRWQASGCFLFTPNHPMLRVMIDIGVALVEKMGQTIHLRRPDRLMVDPFQNGPIFPVFPEIASRIGLDGDYMFRGPVKNAADFTPWQAGLDLVPFLHKFYAQNKELVLSGVECKRFEGGRYDFLLDLKNRSTVKASPRHPYTGLPPYQFWRKAMSGLKIEEFDPIANTRFRLKRTDRIATAGSCFAQHVAKKLKSANYNFLVTESAPSSGNAAESHSNYGVYTARFGNIYTARQLVQLFDRSEGTFTPADEAWKRTHGYADPFRPEIEPNGFASVADLLAERELHLRAVRQMWRQLDVFVFTLGLTEAWRSKIDGAVFPLAPGVVAGEMDNDRYEFYNFSAEEVTEDLIGFCERIRSVNLNARIIFTVSPVPLVATYENTHVLVSTTYSKSVLRAAVGSVIRKSAAVEYFPSYEIITGAYSKGRYFEDDLRNVSEEGVSHVMRVFLKHFGTENSDKSDVGMADSLEIEIAVAQGIICEEELLDV